MRPSLVDNESLSDEAASPEKVGRLVDHFFRHESGRLVSLLSRVFGLRNLDLVEDTVQSALVEALQAWRIQGVPDNPSGWLHRVARNKVLDTLRQHKTLLRIAPAWAQLHPDVSNPQFDELFVDSEIEDSQLRMMFACCHPSLTRENQIALTLKTLCGFSNTEIARGLLVGEETIKKRLQRAKQQLIEEQVELTVPRADELPERRDAVHQCLYLLFNEGYAASAGDQAVRIDLCEEAARLCHLLCGNTVVHSPATHALLALMLFHAARLDARTDAEGRLLLLEDQDRSKWDRRLIEQARRSLDRSAEGRQASTYHLEAGIALYHCSAPSFAETDWASILKMYDVLIRLDPSPLYHLNRAIVLAHIHGPIAGIDALMALAREPSLKSYHLVDAALGELHRRAGDMRKAQHHFERARTATRSPAEQELLDRRLASCILPDSSV